ncbi:MAG TPA: alkene reductase [Ramlibacter sp.]|jgi:N-ethylmaleimide reductase|nr:alkene reductase [Ramlibacter sp.]
MTPHRTLFEPIRAGSLALRNRIVMAPLTRNRAPDAIPTALMAQYYEQRASAGLIISEATSISHQGQGYADVPGLYAPEQLQGWRRVTDAVHARGGCMVCQLFHVGRISRFELQPGGAAPVAPSALAARARTYLIQDGQGSFVDTSPPRALQASELPGIVDDFRRAADGAVRVARFDGVEIHAANGYLLDQFLQRGSNQRTDAYGGPVENRARLLLEVAAAIAQEVGAHRVGIRLSPVATGNDMHDPEPQALFEHVVRALAPLGLAYLHVIEGSPGGLRTRPERPFDYQALQRAYRDAGGSAAWMVNNGYDAGVAAEAVAGGADLVAFGRPYIANPDFVERLRRGAPLATLDPETLYGGGARGYTDYPALAG